MPPRRGAETAISNAWEKFLGGDRMPHDAVRRLVEDSWRRCLDEGVNPVRRAAPLAVDVDGLESLRRKHSELVEAARPVMEQAREFLTESGTIMVLTDPSGVILGVEGDAGARDSGQGIALVPGGHWDEAISGTNAIGTALASGQPVQILAAEHFCEGIKHWTCSASIIRDPYDGTPLGALDVSGLSGTHNMHCLALAVAGAGRIEARLAALEMEKRSRLLELTLYSGPRCSDNGLVIFDRRGRLIRANENAGLFFDGIGLDLKACESLDIGGVNSTTTGSPLPNWLQDHWLEPVIERNERLGTVLAIPMPRHRTVAAQQVSASAIAGDRQGGAFAGIVGTSTALARVKERARQLGKLDVPVLLLGPTGAGKELFAHALHQLGPNPSGPFVPLNCGGMTRELLASELFGYVEGAFTGARRGGMIGKFAAADTGTLFLDEIAEIPLDLQAHFLRVLDSGEVYRLGENKPRKVKVRVVAATNRDLHAEVAGGHFRMDLYYRLAVTVLRLPGLAERRPDIPQLAQYFADKIVARYGLPKKVLSAALLDAISAYSWPGNVRELRNVVEGMVLLAEGPVLTIEDLPPEILSPAEIAALRPQDPTAEAPVKWQRGDGERMAIAEAIHREDGNLTRVAARLGIARSTLYEKMKRYGIDRDLAGRGAVIG